MTPTRKSQTAKWKGHTFLITSEPDCDGDLRWGFVLANGCRQIPNWFTRKRAIAAAIFHIEKHGLVASK